MLRLEHLRIVQGDWRLEADAAFAAGTATALIGPSGGGKSTLLAAIAGFVRPAGGRVLWQGRRIEGLPPAERPVTLLFQEHNLFAHLSAAENVGLGLRPDLRLSRAQKAAVEAALEQVGLPGLGARLPERLSGGQRQRVALARALLRRRPLLMLDEPFAALGPAMRAEMLALVDRIRREQDATLLMVTHQPEDARAICEHTAVVAEGRVTEPRETHSLLERPPPILRAYLG